MKRPAPRARFALVCLVALIGLRACQPEQLPPPEQLLFAEGELPGHWTADPEGSHTPTGQAPLAGGPGAIAAAVIFFHHPAGDGTAGASEQISLFGSEWDAHAEFNDFLPTAFNDRPDWRWVDAGAARSVTPTASESTFRCTEGRSEVMCRLVARYGRYLVDLKVDLDGTNSDLQPVRVMSIDDLMALILVLDGRMALATDE
jgi:hypothetical protein